MNNQQMMELTTVEKSEFEQLVSEFLYLKHL